MLSGALAAVVHESPKRYVLRRNDELLGWTQTICWKSLRDKVDL